jgi:hypothetical protein
MSDNKVLIDALRAEAALALVQEVTDGFGSTWSKCSHSSCDLQVVRPGKVQCSGYCAGAQDDATKEHP